MPDLHEEHKTIAKGTFWGLVGRVSISFLAFVYLIVIARLFPQSDVGTFYLALSIMGVITIFADVGLSSAFLRYFPFYLGKGEKEKAYSLLRGSYVLSGFLSIAIAALLLILSGAIAASFRNPGLQFPLQLFSMFLIANTFFTLNMNSLTGLKRIKDTQLLQAVQEVLKLILTVGFFFAIGSNSASLALGFAISYIIAAIASFIYVRSAFRKESIAGAGKGILHEVKELREVVSFGFLLTVLASFGFIATYINRIMLGYMLPPDAATVGIAVYAIACSLAAIIEIFPSAVKSIFFPIVTELFGKGEKEKILQVSGSALRWSVFLSAPITAVFVVFPEQILQLFYGSSYVAGAAVLAIFSIGLFIRSLSQIHNVIFGALRIVRLDIVAMAAAVNLVLNLFLIPLWGIEGTAIASCASFLVLTGLNIYYVKKESGFGFPESVRKPIIAGILSLVAIFLLKAWASQAFGIVPDAGFFGEGIAGAIVQKLAKLAVLGIMFMFSFAIYFAFLFILRGFASEDKGLLKAAMRRAKVPDRWALMAENSVSLFEG